MLTSFPRKDLCLSFIEIQRISFRNLFSFDAGGGKQISTFGFVLKGKVKFSSALKVVEAKAGDLVYIPEGTRYISFWSGEPDIEYFSIPLVFPKSTALPLDRRFEMQRIDKLSTPETEALLIELYELMKQGDDLSCLTALSKFYAFLSETVVLMKTTDYSKFSPCVLSALQYIESHYNEDYKMADVAKFAFVSESHLYHRFKKELHTSPIAYRNQIRIQNSLEYLQSNKHKIEEISQKVGFHSALRFREAFKSITKLTPSESKKLNL